MGNYVELHSDKRSESLDIEAIGKETFIHWNGTLLQRQTGLGDKQLIEYSERGGGTS